jgi:hypothetical protein
MKSEYKYVTLTVLACLCFFISKGQVLKMNQTQVIGSHNSYKIGIEKPLMDLILQENPKAIGLAYTHIPLAEQLDLGLRSLEIDVVYDPEGGLFSNPKGLEMLTTAGVNPLPYNAEPMKRPGFKVLHVPDIDFRSHCATFKGCLADILTWSKAHNNHLPIIITINPKSDGLDRPGFAKVIPFDKQVLDALDREIWEVFDGSELITPRQVKGKQATLRDAVIDNGWPDLTGARGKVLFVFDAGKDLTDMYLQNDEAYARPMFANTGSDNPHAAFFIMNDPVKQEKEITVLVKQGFMVRTRSDADTREARLGDKTRFEAAMRSGAQVITTDYYLKSLSPDKDFEIIFGDGRYQRCNPVLTKSSTCDLP